MKKIAISSILFSSLSFSAFALNLSPTIESIIGADNYRKNLPLINKLFADETQFLVNGKADPVLISSRLKKNGLLKFDLGKSQTIQANFYSVGNSSMFLKILTDSLQELGYVKYHILEASMDSGNVLLQIELKSDSLIDPENLYESIKKHNCSITSIRQDDKLKWNYEIDTSSAVLDTIKLNKNQNIQLPTPTSDYWLSIETNGIIELISSANNWHPFISFYDKKLNLLNSFRINDKKNELSLKVPKTVTYIRISDIYNINNIKNGLKVRFK